MYMIHPEWDNNWFPFPHYKYQPDLHQQPDSPEYPIQREKLKSQKQHTQMEIHQWQTLPIYPKMFRSLTTRHLFERLPGIPAA